MKFKTGKLPTDFKERIIYLYRFQEVLRLLHNIKAQDVKNKKITLKQFRDFQNNWFEKRNDLICDEINKCKSSFKQDESVVINIDDIEE